MAKIQTVEVTKGLSFDNPNKPTECAVIKINTFWGVTHYFMNKETWELCGKVTGWNKQKGEKE